MRKGIKAFLLAACICSTSFSVLSVPYHTACAYQLIASLQGVSIFKETLAVGESAPLELTWSNGAHPELTYTSSDESVATVDQDGIVTGVADGTATIIVAYANGNNSKSLDIAVSSEVDKSITYNTSELLLGDKVRKYDILHYDGKNKGSTANVINMKGSYDLVFINERDYILPFDAEYVGDWGTCMYLAPDIDGLTYLDGRTLTAGDVIDRNTHLLCYDYYIKSADSSNRMMYPVFLPEYYSKYIGDGEIRVSMIDHDTKTIELQSVDVPADSTASMLLSVQITSEPYDKVVHGDDELDITGLKLTITETNVNGIITSLLEDVTIEEAKENYDVTVTIKDDAPGSGICQITVTKKNEDIIDAASFKISYGAPVVKGDVNSDGELNISDVVLLQKWLLAVPDTKLPDWNRADLCRDGILNVFDLCLMKRELLTKSDIAPTIPSSTQDISFSSIDELLTMLSENESDITPEDEAILRPFKSDGFVYTFTNSNSTENEITLNSDRKIWLLSYARFEDIGVLYHTLYKENDYQVYFYHADKQYSGEYQNFKDYNELRLGFKTIGDISVNGLDYTLLPTGVKDNDIISEFLVLTLLLMQIIILRLKQKHQKMN